MTIEELYQQTTALMRDGKSGAAFKLLDEFITVQQYELDRLKVEYDKSQKELAWQGKRATEYLNELERLRDRRILPDWFVNTIYSHYIHPTRECVEPDVTAIKILNFKLTRLDNGDWELEREE